MNGERKSQKHWEETGTEPDKHGILKGALLNKYLEHRVTSYETWANVVGSAVGNIHNSHKKYLPQIFTVVEELTDGVRLQEGDWVKVSLGPAKFLAVVTRVVGNDKLIVDLYPMRRKEEVSVNHVERTDQRPVLLDR